MARQSSVGVSYVREYNQRSVLARIFEKKRTSRTELARELHMSKPAISDNLAYPLRIGLIRETDETLQPQSGGRPAVVLKFNDDHRFIVAIDLNYSQLVFVLGNLRGNILREFKISVSKSASPESCISVVESGIDILLNSKGVHREDFFAIAVSLPGTYDSEGRLCSENEGYAGIRWTAIGLKGALEKRFGVEVIFKNDVKAATLGEWIDGAGKGADSLMYVNVGIGLGTGIVLNSRLLEGARFTAGEIYDHFADMDKMLRGETLEDMVAMKALTDRYLELLPPARREDLSGDEWRCFEALLKDYRAGSAEVIHLVEDICKAVFLVVLDCVNILDLDRIVFGGDYAAFSDTVIDCFTKYFMPRCRHQPELRITELNRYSGIHGLFYLARERYFDLVCSHNGAEEHDPVLHRKGVEKIEGGINP